MKETAQSNLSIPRSLKNIIRSRAASNNMFVAEYLSRLILKSLESGSSEVGVRPSRHSLEIRDSTEQKNAF
jgi:hypothetical protein